MNGGIKAYLKCISNQQLKGTPLHRPRDWEGRRSRRNRDNWFQPTEVNNVYSSVIFVPAAPGSTLVKMLQELEERNVQGRAHRVKFVEKAGISVKNILSKNYPWSVKKCEDSGCFQCSTCPTPLFSCRKPGIGYRISCLKCDETGVTSVYEGESSKCGFARGKKHLEELESACKSNCMVIHNTIHHDSPTEMNFQMKIIKTFHSPMDRHINESVRINNSEADVIMNSGSEWRSNRIPRATFHPIENSTR